MKTGHQALGRLAEAKKTTMSKPSRSNSNLDLSQLLDRWKARPEVTIEAVIWNKESLGYRRGVKRLLSIIHRAQKGSCESKVSIPGIQYNGSGSVSSCNYHEQKIQGYIL